MKSFTASLVCDSTRPCLRAAVTWVPEYLQQVSVGIAKIAGVGPPGTVVRSVGERGPGGLAWLSRVSISTLLATPCPMLNSPAFGGPNGTPASLARSLRELSHRTGPSRSSNVAMAPAGLTSPPTNSVPTTLCDSSSRPSQQKSSARSGLATASVIMSRRASSRAPGLTAPEGRSWCGRADPLVRAGDPRA